MINYDKVLNDMFPPEKETSDQKLPSKKGIILAKSQSTEMADPKVEWKDPFDIKAVEVAFNDTEVRMLVTKAKDFHVESDFQAKEGFDLAMTARRMASDIGKARKSITEPHLRFQKKCIAIEKEYTTQLESAETILLSRVEDYKAERKKRLEENNIVDPSFDDFKTEQGSCKTKMVYDFLLLDIEAVPREYLKLDTAKIKEALKKGVRKIPGLEIHKTEKKQYRMRKKK